MFRYVSRVFSCFFTDQSVNWSYFLKSWHFDDPQSFIFTFVGGKLPKLFKKASCTYFSGSSGFSGRFCGKTPQIDQIFQFSKSRHFSTFLDFFSTFLDVSWRFSTFFLDVSRRLFSTFLDVFSTFSRHFFCRFPRSPFFVFLVLFLFSCSIFVFCLLFFFFCSIFVFLLYFCFFEPRFTMSCSFLCFLHTFARKSFVGFFWRCYVQFVYFHADSLNFSHCTRATQEKDN